jgi:hypothetical protein
LRKELENKKAQEQYIERLLQENVSASWITEKYPYDTPRLF